MDLTLDTMRDKFLRCKQIVADGMLNEYKFGEDETNRDHQTLKVLKDSGIYNFTEPPGRVIALIL